MGLFPLAAGVVSAAFSLQLLRQFAGQRKAHQLAWGLAMAAFGIASLSAAAGIVFGWSTGLFRSFYFFGAMINVPMLALGTLLLHSPRRVGPLAAIVVAGAVAYGAVAVLSTGLLAPLAGARGGIPAGTEFMPAGVRALSRIYSYGGFLVVVVGAVWSALRLARRPEARLRRLAQGNALIAAGTFVVAVGSAFARYGQGAWFAVALAAGVSVMFAGFLRTRGPVIWETDSVLTEPLAEPAAG